MIRTIRRAAAAGAVASLDVIVNSLPDRLRFAVDRVWPPDFWDCVQPDGDRYRWRCPDPNFQWHHGVDDQGWSTSHVDAMLRLARHWGVHHIHWNDVAEDHEAFDEVTS